MGVIDDFKAEYARQHPSRPALSSLTDESLVWATLYESQSAQLAALKARLFAIENRDSDH